MLDASSRRLSGFIEPCLPRGAKQPAAGPGWIHEIKHDGYRIIAERDHGRVKLYTRNGYDFADRFPLARAAVAKLSVRSCLIDGEAIRHGQVPAPRSCRDAMRLRSARAQKIKYPAAPAVRREAEEEWN